MATFTTNLTTENTVLATIKAAFARAIEKAAARRQYRITVTELSCLSQRELDDLGIARSDIKGVARRAAFNF